MAPGFELMGWLKQAGAQTGTSADVAAQPATDAAPAGPATNTAPIAAAPSRITAPHSQAAAALAAALSAGGVSEKKHPQPLGTPITSLQEAVEVDRIRPDLTAALVVSKIANYPSEICRRHGHAIAVDANYICYGLKGGQIRILNRHTAARTLLKDHVAPVTDLRFFRHDSERCLLASVDTSGKVHVRKVFEEDTDGEDTVRDELLAQHELPIPTSGPTAHPPARLAWHPTYDFVLAVAAGPTVYLINVPPTADVAAAPEYSAPVAAARSSDGAVMTAVAFSPSGDLLAAGDARGFVYVWALTPEQLDPALIQPLAAEPDIRFQAYGSAPGEAPYGDGTIDSAAVVSLSWLPGRGSVESGVGTEEGIGAAAPLVLLTGDGVNAHLRLWTIDLSSKPQCTHAIRLTSASGGAATAASAAFFNHLEAQPLYDCVVLANELQNHVYVLHVDLASQRDAPTFDYVSEFSVKMPILSCTLVPEVFEDEATGAEAFHMYTMQSDAVQQYTLVPAQCFPLPPQPGGAGTAAPAGAAATAISGHAGHYAHFHLGGGAHGPGRTAPVGIDALRHSKDPLAALLALQQMQRQQQHQQQEKGKEASVLHPPQAPSSLVGMPSDVSDATSPLLVVGGAAGGHAAAREAVPAGSDDAAVAASVLEQVVGMQAALEAPAIEEAASAEALDAAVVAVAGEAAAAMEQALSACAGDVTVPPPQPTATARPALLLTPSQLMQSAAAAAAAARSAASSSASTPAPGLPTVPQGEPFGYAASAGGDNDTAASTAGTSCSHSIATASNVLTPSGSNANLAAAAAAAAAEVAAAEEGEAEAAEARADSEEGDMAAAAEAVKALPASSTPSVPAAAAQAPSGLPPQPSELLVRRISQGRTSPAPPHAGAAAQRTQSAPPPNPAPAPASAPAGATVPTSVEEPAPPPPTAAPAPAAAVAGGEDKRADAAAVVGEVPSGFASTAATQAAPSPDVQAQAQAQQQALAQLLALHQQLLDQVSAGQRELLKVVRAEAQRSSKAAADAAATRAAEAVARKAAEERRKETAELQKAVTGAINHATKDLSQRVADAAAATTAAVKAAIGPAVRAAVAEALPAALSAGGAAAALERALGSQLSASLPRAVADGLGAAFTAQVVPPLERATSTMFSQIEVALRIGLDAHLTPLGPLANLGGQLRDAASQVQAAAKSLKSEAAAAQQAAVAASRAATAAAAATVAMPVPSATATASASPAAAANGAGAAKSGTKAAAVSAVGPARSVAAETPAVASTAAAVVADSRAAPAAPRPQPAATHAPAGTPSGGRAEPAPAAAALAAASSTPAAPAAAPPSPLPAALDPATLALIRAGDIDGALSRVLERQDLALVLWACSEAGGAAILAREPCPLGQPTMLSLLTFLSYDLTADVDLKLGWIDAILKRLDVREPGLAPHIRGVLDSVKAALAVIARRGTDATATKAKQAVHQAIGLIAMLS